MQDRSLDFPMKQLLVFAFIAMACPLQALSSSGSHPATESFSPSAYTRRLSEAIAIKDRLYIDYALNPFVAPRTMYDDGTGRQLHNDLMISLLDIPVLQQALQEMRQLTTILQDLVNSTTLASRNVNWITRRYWENRTSELSTLKNFVEANQRLIEERIRLRTTGRPAHNQS